MIRKKRRERKKKKKKKEGKEKEEHRYGTMNNCMELWVLVWNLSMVLYG